MKLLAQSKTGSRSAGQAVLAGRQFAALRAERVNGGGVQMRPAQPSTLNLLFTRAFTSTQSAYAGGHDSSVVRTSTGASAPRRAGLEQAR